MKSLGDFLADFHGTGIFTLDVYFRHPLLEAVSQAS